MLSSEPVATLAHASKVFSRTARRAGSFKETLLKSLSERAQRDLVHAVDDLSLVLHPGEALGVIGPNGAGKSTLLKLLAGIMQPSGGSVTTRGRVLGLIELGAGFHPELSGEENIRLQGALYGLDAAQLEGKLEPILEFSGLGEFRHLPVKHYSSGMFVRLGFAIAIHAAPDLLLVDEVLAVGDMEFQQRCLDEIARLRRRGTALILVTHFPEQTERLCDRVAWLEAGRLHALGPAGEVLAAWQSDLIQRRFPEPHGRLDADAVALGLPGRFGDARARIEAVRLLDGAGRLRTAFATGDALRIEIDYTAEPGIAAIDCAVPMAFNDAFILNYDRAAHAHCPGHPVDGRGRFTLDYPSLDLLPGRYGITVALSEPGNIHAHHDVLYKLIYFTIAPQAEWPSVAPVALRAAMR